MASQRDTLACKSVRRTLRPQRRATKKSKKSCPLLAFAKTTNKPVLISDHRYTMNAGDAVLVTGASGFIGSHLCEALVSYGCLVVGLDVREPKHGHFSLFVQGDVCNRSTVASLCSRFHFCVVYHLAALSGVRLCEKRAEEAHRINVVGTGVLLEALNACEHDVHCVVASSSLVYGRQPTPWSETVGFGKELPVYASTKSLAERLCTGFTVGLC